MSEWLVHHPRAEEEMTGNGEREEREMEVRDRRLVYIVMVGHDMIDLNSASNQQLNNAASLIL